MIDASEISPDELRPLRRSEYDRLVRAGVFCDERIELLAGMLVAVSPQGTEHSYAVRRLARALMRALGDRAEIFVQAPLALSAASEPEPDIAVVAPGDYLDEHPRSALLIVEVADTSLQKDSGPKARLYAEAGIQDYWIVDLTNDAVLLHRAPSGGAYTTLSRHQRGETIAMLACPDVDVSVDEVLPPPRA
ncbi:MAG TPA: Uma2 family endonuclease [Kofleriaceae bacterium]|nr:Uma2 family endonuclease [Kofleriaceae bacterium]